ncbi:phosphoglycerate transporter family protein [alpha proteobacterium Q-1]|nr:phosphoglycerate transporter family protein [alpha proteobacterium Q-1]
MHHYHGPGPLDILPAMTYLRFIKNHPRRLLMGFSLTLFASFGQTYFIALFSGELREAFDLSVSGFGSVYSMATLLSGFSVLYFGGLIDRFALPLYLFVIVSVLALASLALALLPFQSVAFLFVIIFLFRLCGQGLMGHAASTSMARDFIENRGKAISFASMGHAAGEALFPILAVAIMASFGWHMTWLSIAILLFLYLPVLVWLASTRKSAGAKPDESVATSDLGTSWTRGEAIRDRAFYLLLVAMIAPPFINTGVFFLQIPLIEAKGWSLPLFAAAFSLYALTTVFGILLAGRLVDRTSAFDVLVYAMLPYGLGLFVIALSDHMSVIYIFMAMAGLTTGLFYPCATAVWAELYGLGHLGSIRALTSSLMVFSTSLSPALMGFLLDLGISFSVLFLGCALWALISVPAVLKARQINRERHRIELGS